MTLFDDAQENPDNPLYLRATANGGGESLNSLMVDDNSLNVLRWRRNYTPGDRCIANEAVRDDGWLMVANATTDDPAAPTPDGDPIIVYPTDPTWTVNQYEGHVYQGIEITVPAEGLYRLSEIRVWLEGVTAADHYQVFVQNAAGLIEQIADFDGDILTESGWLGVPWRADLLPPGQSGRVWLHSWNSASDTTQTYQWSRVANSNQDGDPGSGNWNTRNNNAAVRINDLDDGGVDRSAVTNDPTLVGSVLRIQQASDVNKWREWIIDSITDNGGFVVYGTSTIGNGPGGDPDVGALCDITFALPVIAQVAYVSLAGHLAQFPSLQSYTALDSLGTGAPSQDGVGIDLVFQPYHLSEHWDVMVAPQSIGTLGR